jgi:predicted enzyme related to lactoylglutathione lyase
MASNHISVKVQFNLNQGVVMAENSKENGTNHVVWFDIPVIDLKRAVEFYSRVLSLKIDVYETEPGCSMGVFEHTNQGVSGCLYTDKVARPSAQGPLLYFNAQGRLDDAIAQVEKHGGKILEPKHQIGPHGFRSVVLDSEGNRIALHSM